MNRFVPTLMLAGALSLPFVGGCSETISKKETVRTSPDGDKSVDRETLKQRPDGTVVRERETEKVRQ